MLNTYLSDTEILTNSDKPKFKKPKSKKKLSPNEEVITDYQFDHFNDERMAVKSPCDVKFGTTVARIPIWIKVLKNVMKDKFLVEEKQVNYGIQFNCFEKDGNSKFVSTTIYNSGTILVQGKNSCVKWKDDYFHRMQTLVNIEESEVRPVLNTSQTESKIHVINSESATETIPKEVNDSVSFSHSSWLSSTVLSDPSVDQPVIHDPELSPINQITNTGAGESKSLHSVSSEIKDSLAILTEQNSIFLTLFRQKMNKFPV